MSEQSLGPRGGSDKRVLLLGAGGSAGINFIQCLVDCGVEIHATDMNKWHLELLPASVHKHVTPACYEKGWIEAVSTLIADVKPGLVHAQPDVEVGALSTHRDRLGANVFMPTDEEIVTAHDKIALIRQLRETGAAAPESYYRSELEQAVEVLPLPWWVRARVGAGSRGAFKATTVDQAVRWMDLMTEIGKIGEDDWMISEYLPGRDYAYQSLWYEGELITSAVRRRDEYLLGYLTATGQSSSPAVAVTVHNEAANVAAIRGIRGLALGKKPHGIYCVDMKEDVEGEPLVTEINIGRFYTTAGLYFAMLGVNMPRMFVDIGLGVKIAELDPGYQRGRTNAVPAGHRWVRLPDALPVLCPPE